MLGKMGDEILGRPLEDVVKEIRDIATDTQRIEVKSSVGKDILPTLSAFSNSGGGILIIGLSEREGFTVAKGFDASAAQNALVSRCNQMTPRVHPEIRIEPFEGSSVIVASVPEISAHEKPCYVTERGRYGGSFRRSGEGDQKLLQYEVDRLLEEQRPPRWDEDPVEEAELADLDSHVLNAFLESQRAIRPRTFADGQETALTRLKVLKDGKPTLAALLAMGEYPQEFFPRLTATFALFPGTSKGNIGTGSRMLDSKSFAGPIHEIVENVVSAVRVNMREGGFIGEVYREELPDYPLVAVREAIVNALMHRDYSPQARGTQVQVNMFVDRLEIMSPGGLYGGVTLESLGTAGQSSTRNERLATFLESPALPGGALAENRGTGIQVIQTALERALMPPAEMYNDLTQFTIIFRKRRVAPTERYATAYDKVKAQLESQESASTTELMEKTKLSRTSIQRAINRLIEDGIAEPTEPPRSPRQRYRAR